MPSLQDSVVIFVLALILVGPKNLPKLARQLGKLMAEFRRASNEFRMQMEDELRMEEQKEHQAKVDAMAGPPSTLPDPEHPHLPASTDEVSAEPAPIAQSGDLKMMPPTTGLPIGNGNYSNARTYGEAPADEAPVDETPAHDGPDNPFILPPVSDTTILPPAYEAESYEAQDYGASSDEPATEAAPPVHTGGEQATHA